MKEFLLKVLSRRNNYLLPSLMILLLGVAFSVVVWENRRHIEMNHVFFEGVVPAIAAIMGLSLNLPAILSIKISSNQGIEKEQGRIIHECSYAIMLWTAIILFADVISLMVSCDQLKMIIECSVLGFVLALLLTFCLYLYVVLRPGWKDVVKKNNDKNKKDYELLKRSLYDFEVSLKDEDKDMYSKIDELPDLNGKEKKYIKRVLFRFNNDIIIPNKELTRIREILLKCRDINNLN